VKKEFLPGFDAFFNNRLPKIRSAIGKYKIQITLRVTCAGSLDHKKGGEERNQESSKFAKHSGVAPKTSDQLFERCDVSPGISQTFTA
jgi:hypothetical protein